jgi:uncharacterized protein (TIGR03084 family)
VSGAGVPPAELALLVEETAELDATLSALPSADWYVVSAFKGWRVFDHVHHLNFSDKRAGLAVADPEAFRALREATRAVVGPARTLGPDGPPDLAPAELLVRWRRGAAALAAAMADIAPDARVPWFGPDMSLRAFVVARLMETWAHGQTIHDTLGLVRAPTDRLRPICELGWRTRGWSFAVRGLPAPVEPLALRLTGPSGAVWTWGSEAASDRIEGKAEDFALVVCQCRNVADTELAVTGEAAKAWMAIAQCFAGAAPDPPPPGTRGVLGRGNAT